MGTRNARLLFAALAACVVAAVVGGTLGGLNLASGRAPSPTPAVAAVPSLSPTDAPTRSPVRTPTRAPSRRPTTQKPSRRPTRAPTPPTTWSPSRAPAPRTLPLGTYVWASRTGTGNDAVPFEQTCAHDRYEIDVPCETAAVRLRASAGVALADLPAASGFDATRPVRSSGNTLLAGSWASFLALTDLGTALNRPGVTPIAWWTGVSNACADWTTTADTGTIGLVTGGLGNEFTNRAEYPCAASGVWYLCACGMAPTPAPSSAPTTSKPSRRPTTSRPSVRPSRAPTPPPTAPTQSPVYSSVYLYAYADAPVTGNLGGVAAADAVCHSRIGALPCSSARAAVALGGRTLAQLRGAMGFDTNTPVRGPGGALLATTWDEYAALAPAQASLVSAGVFANAQTNYHWTGHGGATCADWTSTLSTGQRGNTLQNDAMRVQDGAAGACDGSYWLACACF